MDQLQDIGKSEIAPERAAVMLHRLIAHMQIRGVRSDEQLERSIRAIVDDIASHENQINLHPLILEVLKRRVELLRLIQGQLQFLGFRIEKFDEINESLSGEANHG